jgi:hypothetical protein
VRLLEERYARGEITARSSCVGALPYERSGRPGELAKGAARTPRHTRAHTAAQLIDRRRIKSAEPLLARSVASARRGA